MLPSVDSILARLAALNIAAAAGNPVTVEADEFVETKQPARRSRGGY
jgi:hypothetical protein